MISADNVINKAKKEALAATVAAKKKDKSAEDVKPAITKREDALRLNYATQSQQYVQFLFRPMFLLYQICICFPNRIVRIAQYFYFVFNSQHVLCNESYIRGCGGSSWKVC
jgi:hypothetical protein